MVEWLTEKNQWCWQTGDPSVGSAPGNTTDCSRTWITSKCNPEREATGTWGPGATHRSKIHKEQVIRANCNSISSSKYSTWQTYHYCALHWNQWIQQNALKLPRELQCCFWQYDHTVTPKPHLLSPHCTELSQLPPSSNIVLSTCSSLAVSMGLAISGWYF